MFVPLVLLVAFDLDREFFVCSKVTVHVSDLLGLYVVHSLLVMSESLFAKESAATGAMKCNLMFLCHYAD